MSADRHFGLGINCPKCGRPMRYLKSISIGAAGGQTVPIYDCPEHSLWRLDMDGIFRPQAASIH